jgi:phosphate transport system substrate-binding protein
MSQKNETVPLLLALLITGGILGGGFWWFTHNSGFNLGNLQSNNQNSQQSSGDRTNNSTNSTSIASSNNSNFAPPSQVAAGTTIKIDGSTSMVTINKILRNGFELQFPETKVIISAGGSNKGIEDLLAGKVDIAATSRPLKAEEKTRGLTEIPIAKDAIAIVVGNNNSFRRGLTQQQIEDIFQGKVNKWSVLGGESTTIRVINRPGISGTYQVFKEIVLKGNNFGTSPNITIMQEDATTPLLRALGNDGIGYATYAQVANQRTIRTIAVDGLTPEAANYPYQRTLYYVYKQPATPQVEAFLGYTLSPLGKQIVSNIK